MFFTTLAFQISTLSEALSYTISEAIGANRDIVNKRFHEQWRHLICEPLEKCPLHHPIVVVIDALDECESEEDIGELLRIISQVKDIHACSLRFFITSRPEIPVKHGFENMPYVCFYDYALHEMDDNLVKPDITVYLTSELESINRKYSSSDNWPSKEEVRRLAGQAGKFFIYAATACRFIDRGGPSLFKERLAEILEDDSDGSGEIDKMYTQILEHSIRNFRDKDKRRFFERFQSIVGAVAVLFSPLTAVAMGGLLSESNQAIEHITEETIQRTLSPFSSILDIPESEDIPIRPFHLSFRDFLLNEKRCKNKDFWIPEKNMHSYLVDCCLRLMSAKLKRNICGLQGSDVFASEVNGRVVFECLPSHVQYACQYWTKHLGRFMELHEGEFDIPDRGQVHAFLKSHFLHWLEALSLMGKVSDGIHMILQLINFTVSGYDIALSL
jgi:WD40 repeat protein